MPKRSLKQIQRDEKKILEKLARNANKSINDIAKNLGFSRQKVWRIINNLEGNHTIWGYVAVVDEEKIDKKSFILLIKRTSKPFPQNMIKKIVDRDLSVRGKKLGIEMINSYYTHGVYDWIICFNANDLRDAKSFVEVFNELYTGYVSEVHLVENMFKALNFGVVNPDIERLGDFFKL